MNDYSKLLLLLPRTSLKLDFCSCFYSCVNFWNRKDRWIEHFSNMWRSFSFHVFCKHFSLFQEQRIRQMGHFFSSVASLLSSQLRSVIFKSISDFLNLLEQFSDGNVYEGNYEESNMRYKNLYPPFLISMVRVLTRGAVALQYFCILLQDAFWGKIGLFQTSIVWKKYR